ncbi:uncharacterized protein LOC110464259 [Mizuhopecten yessoensis]|uniref:THD domain-containing protein n=1 Tax=Mizuhopecten yessoensis TaxID=6573 RepID=A0A210PUE2_MIZYE|nr:uncharacterized protein LOC110464259 [Mizuhopecten yessoensis]OWF40066.1 hypothetical protein KP79_PYT02288 [Mizuhopecten yessoensis]
MAAGESSSERMVDEESHAVQTKRPQCAKPRTLALFFVVSILLNFLLVSIMLGLLLAGKLAKEPGTSDEQEAKTTIKPAVKGATLDLKSDMDQVCIQCDPGEGVKLNLVTLYPINNGTQPLCCTEYTQPGLTDWGLKSRQDYDFSHALDSGVSSFDCPPTSDGRVQPAGLAFLDFERSSDGGLRWTQYDGSYLRGGVTITTIGSYTMLQVPEDGLYRVYSDLEFRGNLDSEEDVTKANIQVHSLVRFPNKVVQMNRFTLKENDIKKSVATAVLELNAQDAIFVAVKDISYIYDDSSVNRFGLYKLS